MSEQLTTYVLPEPKRRQPRAVVALGVAVAATLAAGAFAAVSFGASDGSGSPEAAVEKLVAAVEQSDVVGILESLTPGERSSLLPGLEGVAGELERLGVLEAGFELGPISGIELDIEGLQLSSAPLGDGVSAVTIEAGTVTTSTDVAALPLGPLLDVLLADAASPADVVAEDLAGSDESVIVAIEEGGGWHVSLWYTVAEMARRSSGKAAPAFGHGVAPHGAASPEAALSEAVDAALGLDAGGVIALLDPDEARALQDYAPLFLAEADAAAAEVVAGGEFALHLDGLDTTVDRDGGTARVTVDGFAVSGRIPDEGAVSVAFDGACFTFESESDGPEEQCLDDLGEAAGAGVAPGDVQMSVTAVERDGQWYLSPTRSALDGLVAGLQQLDAGDLTDMGASLGGLLGGGLLGLSAVGGSNDSSSGHGSAVAPEAAAEVEKCLAVLEQEARAASQPGEGSWSAYEDCVAVLPHATTTTPTTAAPG